MDYQQDQPLLIRAARPDDIIQCLRIQTDALRILCTKEYSKHQIEALIARNIRHSSYGGSDDITIVAEVDRTVVGCAALMNCRISALFVHPQFARQGIGSKLLQSLEYVALQNHIPSLKVAASLTAQRFYQIHGYQFLGKSCLREKHDLHIPYVNMAKRLSQVTTPPNARRLR